MLILIWLKDFIYFRLKKLFFHLGYDFKKLNTKIGHDPFKDINFILKYKSDPVVFDVGANTGQSITEIQNTFALASIHAFEPSPKAFSELLKKFPEKSIPFLKLNCTGLGAEAGEFTFFENASSDMSSFLPPGKKNWSRLDHTLKLKIQTLDHYCTEQNIKKINLLKIDTQGYEFEILKGARNMLTEGNIDLILMEIIFSEMYVGIPPFDQIYSFLTSHGYKLITFYQQHYQQDTLSWTDALFKKD